VTPHQRRQVHVRPLRRQPRLAKPGWVGNLTRMSVAELQKTIRGMSAGDRRALAAIAVRMKQRHGAARRRKLTAAMRAMDAGKKFTWDEVKQSRAERRKASDG
jgi:hypothetical protein